MVIKKTTQHLTKFKSEFRNQVSTALLTAFGLVIALAWKDVVVDLASKLNPFQGQNILLSAIIITIIGIIGIAIISILTKKSQETK